MEQLLGSSITYLIAVGPQQGRKVFTLQTLPACDELFDDGVGKVAGFHSVHSCTFETYDGIDTSALRIRSVSASGFQVKVEEEASRAIETAHTTEGVGYLAAEAGVITDAYGEVIGEAGSISRRQSNAHQWHTVNLTEVHASPVVMMNMVTYAGKQPTHVRVRNVGPSSFGFQLEEWDYLDGAHIEEQLHYVVLQSGIHELPGERNPEVGRVKAKMPSARSSHAR